MSLNFTGKDRDTDLSGGRDFKWNDSVEPMTESVTSVRTQVCNAYPKLRSCWDIQVCISGNLELRI